MVVTPFLRSPSKTWRGRWSPVIGPLTQSRVGMDHLQQAQSRGAITIRVGGSSFTGVTCRVQKGWNSQARAATDPNPAQHTTALLRAAMTARRLMKHPAGSAGGSAYPIRNGCEAASGSGSIYGLIGR